MPTTPIRSSHDAAGARFTDFGGWEMPLQYQGVIAEHMAVREACGVFDVSHLGRFEVSGTDAVALLRAMLCNDVSKIAPGRAQYTMALTEEGGVSDDIIVWWIDRERLWVMPNGVNFDEIMVSFAQQGARSVTLQPVRSGTVLLAVQGPDAPTKVAAVLGDTPGRFRVTQGEWGGAWYVAAGTGYTGERGAEICVPEETAGQLWDALLEAGTEPCGLGARDTLRLEMGYPLWGQDLDETTTPLEAGLGWVVDWDHDFVGKAALERARGAGAAKRLVGFTVEGRRPPRAGYELRAGSSSGSVTSGNYSPVRRQGIGMGYLTPPPSGSEIEVGMRGSWVRATAVEPPFIDR